MASHFSYIDIATGEDISLHDITPQLKELVTVSNINQGLMVVTSVHTTTAISVNEYEERLLTDIKTFLNRLAPADDKYLHNDIHLRDCPPDEPENAHSHLAAMMLGNSETIAIHNGEMVLGQYQSIMLVELDGPRDRKISVQLTGD